MNPNIQAGTENANAHTALEAEIATFMQQRIEDGDLSLEDIAVRLARYGLMTPEAFIFEMRERMAVNADDTVGGEV